MAIRYEGSGSVEVFCPIGHGTMKSSFKINNLAPDGEFPAKAHLPVRGVYCMDKRF